MVIDDNVARDYWIDRARAFDGPAAVHPDSRWLRYDAWTRRMLQTWTLARVRALAPRYRRAADLGCGYGDWTERFAQLADEIHACDIAPELAAATQRRLVHHRAARVECADIRSFDLPRRLDLVYAGAVFMYLSDRAVGEVLRRIGDAVAPGAVVVIRDFCAFNVARRAERPFDVSRRADELRALAERAGLRCVESRSSPSIYGEVMGGRLLAWPMRALWRLATLHWRRASHTLVLRA
jgi:trans-aconitate methyltransferase